VTVSFPTPRLLSLLATGLVAAALAACGSEDRKGLIPPDDAQALSDRLDAVKASVDDGRCGPLPQELTRLRSALLALPSSLDDRLRRRLDQGLDNLAKISPQACREAALGAAEAPEEEEPEPEPEPTTTTIPTTTTPTEPPPTTATQEPPTTTPPTTTEEPPPGTGGTPIPPDQGTADPGTGAEGDEG